MTTVKKIFLGLVIFSLAFLLGAFYRAIWFFTIQKSQFERRYLYRDLVESKLGGQTPQETWNLYLDALEKGDIDTAVQYWVPEARSAVSSHLSELKKENLLTEFYKNKEKQLQPIDVKEGIETPESKEFTVSYRREKKIDFVGAKGETLEFLNEYWAQQKNSIVQAEEKKIFVLNKYSQRWLIK